MPKEFSRTRRVSELVHRELATLISQEAKDPRIQDVTITAVDVSSDLRIARVFVTKLGIDLDHSASILLPLQKAAGYLRHRLGEQVVLKRLPELKFVYDSSIEKGMSLTKKIEETVQRDQQRHRDD